MCGSDIILGELYRKWAQGHRDYISEQWAAEQRRHWQNSRAVEFWESQAGLDTWERYMKVRRCSFYEKYLDQLIAAELSRPVDFATFEDRDGGKYGAHTADPAQRPQ